MSASDAARTGMLFQQRNVEVIANNIANANTTAYKKSSVRFEDIFTRAFDLFDAAAGATGNLADSEGVLLSSIDRYHTQGDILPSGGAADLAISGAGFFAVTLPDGATAYTRDGSFHLDGERRLVTAEGYLLQPEIIFPDGASQLAISPGGEVTAVFADGTAQSLGTMELTLFANPGGLLAIGENLYTPSENSGEPEAGLAGTGGRGVVGAGFLEGSNVELAEEMTSLMLAQRSYQMNLNAFQTATEMDRLARELAGRS